MKNLKVLTIDGGGLRGIIPLMILREIEKLTNKKIFESFDLMGGASTGGIIVCSLTGSKYGYEPTYSIDEIIKFYDELGDDIFPNHNGIIKAYNNIKSWFRPEFNTSKLETLLKKKFEGMKLNKVLKPIIISSYDLIENKPLIFKSRYCSEKYDPNLYDIVRATSAAPSYFKPHSFKLGNRDVECVDGGLYMNNPSLAAIFDISKNFDYYKCEGILPKNIYLLSLGAGSYKGSISNITNKGKIGWIRPSISVSFRGSSETAAYGAKELLPKGNYFRAEVIVDKKYYDFTDSSEEAKKHWIDKAEEYINSEEFDKLIEFLERADIL